MAMAHARLTARPGIVMDSPGPGVANMFAGFLEANTGCIPLIAPVPSSEMGTEGMAQMQETDMVASFKPVSKWAYRITKSEKVGWGMRRAFSLAGYGKARPGVPRNPHGRGKCRVHGASRTNMSRSEDCAPMKRT